MLFFLVPYLAVASIMDLTCRRVKNSWILLGLGTGPVLNLLSGGLTGGDECPGVGLFSSLAGLGLGMTLILFYFFRLMGAGDVKLLMVSGGYLGGEALAGALVPMIFSAGILLAIFSVIDILWKKCGGGASAVLPFIRQGRLPLAPAMLLGVVCPLPW